ncbi:unnamed protein product [Orchesella dallaii]|uniref:NB-ARC domain-containing protein n=1 Tax=Orchesella dallaii TaxID=48710 RepID=A0ABP1PJ35_9HEXA
MEDRENKHIVGNLSYLVDNTRWKTSCISVLLQTRVFCKDDVAILKAIPNERERILEFYTIIMTKQNSYEHLIAALEKGGQSGALKLLCELDVEKCKSLFELQSTSCASSGTDENLAKLRNREKRKIGHKNSIRFNVYNPVRLFTGRTKELADLHAKLQQSKTKRAVLSQMASIVGLGGIGKTELAKRYIQEYAEKYDGNVIWISAETEKSLTDSFRRLAVDYLKIRTKNVDGKEKHIQSILEEVYNFFKDKPCLFVFDNAESNEELKKFMPLQVAKPPHVLITSRDRDWKFSVEMLELHEMEELEAIEFVKTGLKIEDDSQDDIIQQLVKTLQYFPLALSQAISYISQQQTLRKYEIERYLEEFKACSMKLLNFELKSSEVNTYTKTTFTTWKMTTDVISKDKECGEEAIRILSMISYFEPDKIPTKIFTADIMDKPEPVPDMERMIEILEPIMSNPFLSRFLANDNDNTNFSYSPEKNEKALHLLVKYSMVNVNPEVEAISVHRLVQKVNRIQLRATKFEEETLEHSLRLLSGNTDKESVLNICSVFKFCETYKKLVVDFKDLPYLILRHNSININIPATIDPSTALRIRTDLKNILKKHIPENDIAMIHLDHLIAKEYYMHGNFESAAKIYARILPIYEKNESREFLIPETLDVQYFLELCLKELGKPSEGLKLSLQIYASTNFRDEFLNEWWTTALIEMAKGLQEVGYFDRAFVPNAEFLHALTPGVNVPQPLEIVSRMKEIYVSERKLLGTDVYYSRVLFDIANFFYNIGDNDTAISIATYVCEHGQVSSQDDKMVQLFEMQGLALLANMKDAEGRYKEAYVFCEKAYKLSSKVFGENYIFTLVSKGNMLSQLCALDQAETAYEELCELLQIVMKFYPNIPEVFQVEIQIGYALFRMNRFEESLAFFLDLRRRIVDRFGQSQTLLCEVDRGLKKCRMRK